MSFSVRSRLTRRAWQRAPVEHARGGVDRAGRLGGFRPPLRPPPRRRPARSRRAPRSGCGRRKRSRDRPDSRDGQASTKQLQQARDDVEAEPTPPCRRVADPSPWRKGSKISGSASGEMPIPVSRTLISSNSEPRCSAHDGDLARVGELDRVAERGSMTIFSFADRYRSSGEPAASSQTTRMPGFCCSSRVSASISRSKAAGSTHSARDGCAACLEAARDRGSR